MSMRLFLVGLFAFVLLIWGPLDHSWPFWLWIRTGYLIALPAAAWWLLAWIWRVWQPDAKAEDRLMRTVVGAVAGGLLVGAVLAAQSKYHYECTQEVRTRDGMECVGEYERVPGPDVGEVILLVGGGILALSYGIRASKSKE